MSLSAGPTTPALSDNLDWITAYFTIHSLNVPSRRYSFLLWIIVACICLVFAILHCTGLTSAFLAAHWTKWSLPRRSWGNPRNLAPHRQPRFLPSNAQLLHLSFLFGASIALAFVGADYITPSFNVSQLEAARDLPFPLLHHRNFIPNITPYLPLQPHHTINKAWWSSSARAGQIVFALFPLCILFALKAPPFAIFAIPFIFQVFFDKLAWLHRWTGRLIWFLTSLHVALWSVQLIRDRNPNTGRVAYFTAFSYTPFIFGWIAFALLTLIVALSVHPLRRKFYEAFYLLHILLVPLMLICAAFHHPTIWWWCWLALAIWVGERVWRATWWIATNFIFNDDSSRTPKPNSSLIHPTTCAEIWEMDNLSRQALYAHIDSQSSQTPSPLGSHHQSDKQFVGLHYPPSDHPSPRRSLVTLEPYPSRSAVSSFTPPPGYAHAELLSGHTVRLRLITPGFLPWAPGQHFLINIPSVSHFTTHPFTCASVCDYESPTDEGRLIVMLIRARNGWTRDLWNSVSRMTAEQASGDIPSLAAAVDPPKRGILLRAYVDGPFGSSIRVRWGDYSTVLIIVGGSGVSFGLSVLQYLCMCLSGRDASSLDGGARGWGKKSFLTQRVRFVWLVREYAHIQWCASVVRQCLSLVPATALQIDIFVTKFKPIADKEHSDLPSLHILQQTHVAPEFVSPQDLRPPYPSFAHGGQLFLHYQSSGSIESIESHQSDVDLGYYAAAEFEDPLPLEDVGMLHESHILDLTNFDGDDDTVLPGENNLSHRVKKEGRLRRGYSRKVPVGRKDLVDKTLRLVKHTRNPGNSAKAAIFRHSMDRLAPTQDDTYFASPLALHSNLPIRGPQSTYAESSGSHPPMARGEATSSLYSTASWDAKSEASSFRGLLSSSVPDGSLDSIQFDISDEEAQDVSVVAELARPGKPKLERILADEVEQSKGPIVVACCGPTSLNAMVRNIISAQIDPARVWQGDLRGSISFVSEAFEY